MWSVTLFGFSLIGLLTLFGLKVFELTRNANTPLRHLRAKGDPMVQDLFTRGTATCKDCATTAVHVSTVWTKTTVHNAHLFFDALMHAFALRLNRYLRGRRTQVRKGTVDVSVHLKSVLEKTEGDSSRPGSL